jgi:16S rRNA (guanine527-N7)-methyltransferase
MMGTLRAQLVQQIMLDKLPDVLEEVADVLRELGLANADVLHARAEALGRSEAHRERHDAATARGVASLAVLAELALPLIKVGGLAVFPKGPRAQEEDAAAAAAVRLLGGVADVRAFQMIVVRKVAPTPLAYPRRPGVPARRPLAPGDPDRASGTPARRRRDVRASGRRARRRA